MAPNNSRTGTKRGRNRTERETTSDLAMRRAPVGTPQRQPGRQDQNSQITPVHRGPVQRAGELELPRTEQDDDSEATPRVRSSPQDQDTQRSPSLREPPRRFEELDREMQSRRQAATSPWVSSVVQFPDFEDPLAALSERLGQNPVVEHENIDSSRPNPLRTLNQGAVEVLLALQKLQRKLVENLASNSPQFDAALEEIKAKIAEYQSNNAPQSHGGRNGDVYPDEHGIVQPAPHYAVPAQQASYQPYQAGYPTAPAQQASYHQLYQVGYPTAPAQQASYPPAARYTAPVNQPPLPYNSFQTSRYQDPLQYGPTQTAVYQPPPQQASQATTVPDSYISYEHNPHCRVQPTTSYRDSYAPATSFQDQSYPAPFVHSAGGFIPRHTIRGPPRRTSPPERAPPPGPCSTIPLVADGRDLNSAPFDKVKLTKFLHIVPKGDASIANISITQPIEELKDAVIGVEASAYLYTMMNEPPAQEPLLAALGGEPMGLKLCIQKELERWQENNMTPLFVFEGLSVIGKDDITLMEAKESLQKTEDAWKKYTESDSLGAVTVFGTSGAVRMTEFYPILQEVLNELNLSYMVAPYSACAQIAYLEALPTQFIDGIMGSQELLLYEINDIVITPPTAMDWSNKTFAGISRTDLMSHFGITSRDLFEDALLMLGTSFLAPFPPLLDTTIISQQPYRMRDAINLLNTHNKQITVLCSGFDAEVKAVDPDWQDKFRKAKMGIKHSVVVEERGSVWVRKYFELTGDNMKYIGFRLPEESSQYIADGIFGRRLLNPFTHLQTTIFPTLDGVASEEYKKLVTKQLEPLRQQALAIVLPHFHRGIKFGYGNAVKTRFWFNDALKPVMEFKSLQDPNQQIDTWFVRLPDIKRREKATKTESGKFAFAVLALDDKDFPPAKSVYNTKSTQDRIHDLNPENEVLPNAIWRFLFCRGYFDAKHELTPWGIALKTTLKALRPIVEKFGDVHHLDEAAVLAYELLQFDNLNTRNQHRELIGGALRGSDEDKNSCMLIGRTACLLKLRHKQNGYTGPLSKVFLAYHSLIRAVREADRDIIEAVVGSMLLSNQAIRIEDSNYKPLARSIPFAKDIDIGLGIAVKTYLDDVVKPDMSNEEKQACKVNYAPAKDEDNPEGKGLLPHSVNFPEDLRVAFAFFDALYEGVKTLDNKINADDRKAWDAAKEYLDKRR